VLTQPLSNGQWNWMGQGYPCVTYELPGLTSATAVLLLGTPDDPTSDGLTVAYENLVSHTNPDEADSTGDGMLNGWTVLWDLYPFAIYDQTAFPNAPRMRLGYWKFDNTSYTNQAGYPPTASNSLMNMPDWSGSNVAIISTNSQLAYPTVETGGWTNLNCVNGTVRLWFMPYWSSATNSGGSGGPGSYARIFDVGKYNSSATPGFLDLQFSPDGTTLSFNSYSNGYEQKLSASVDFLSNHWYQLALTYSPTNIALYTNGVLLATENAAPTFSNTSLFNVGEGLVYYPPSTVQAEGFSLGTDTNNQAGPIDAQMDELETFNYPLTAQQVAAGYPNFGGNPTNMLDTYYVGRSDMLQSYVDGNFPPFNSVVQCRLGYWRFDSPLLYAEQGQMPLSVNDVGLAPSWSGTALVINGNPASQITYWDVFTNGWANINCSQGTVRFWFALLNSFIVFPGPYRLRV
jgi:hypothetical protein